MASGRRAYFAAATPEHGMELWASDGTPGGTFLVRDLAPGPESSGPGELRPYGGSLLFVYADALSSVYALRTSGR